MATANERSQSLKETLLESLRAILSPDQSVRQIGEDQLKVLEVTEGMFCGLKTHKKCWEFALFIQKLTYIRNEHSYFRMPNLPEICAFYIINWFRNHFVIKL